ncbi:MAG: hypothetical protein IJG25_04430 [Thermoguttaceae bacterium]|nr:hypothetical protein [Thermoguttaceae bacterium]MBQ6620353.1 hypothetical protein [Thermoguttaceae bacterium]
MRHTTKFQSLTLSRTAELTGRLPYQTPQCRTFTFRGGDPLCATGDDNNGDLGEGEGTTTSNSGEGTGSNGHYTGEN